MFTQMRIWAYLGFYDFLGLLSIGRYVTPYPKSHVLCYLDIDRHRALELSGVRPISNLLILETDSSSLMVYSNILCQRDDLDLDAPVSYYNDT